MAYQTVIYEKSEGIATITLNRPEKLNALNWTMNDELHEIWTDIKADPTVVVAILTGVGERALCTGIDVSLPASGNTQRRGDEHITLHFTAIQNKCWKPVITAVNGMAVGGGLHFISDSDIIIAAEHAQFFDTHVKVGLASVHEPIGLIRRIAFEAVIRMSLMGGLERMSAKRAYELGLVSEVVPKDKLMSRAREIAKTLMKNSPAAMVSSKRAIWGSLNYGLDDALEFGWKVLGEHGKGPDPKEGATAFMQKREPKWSPLPPMK
ncbi:MAG: enoyl-CoA hydratase/isomerase family protein [Chloroflexi bacterium]|nr:enoyl-CoA hydratase/isomerase family protein [Chloroflexota bacterium]